MTPRARRASTWASRGGPSGMRAHVRVSMSAHHRPTGGAAARDPGGAGSAHPVAPRRPKRATRFGLGEQEILRYCDPRHGFLDGAIGQVAPFQEGGAPPPSALRFPAVSESAGGGPTVAAQSTSAPLRMSQSHARRSPMSRRTGLLVAVLAGAMVLTLAATDGSGSGLLCLLPAIVLAAPLVARRYPGEQVLLALGDACHEARPQPSRSVPSGLRHLARVPRGGLLIASSLAVRPPPPLPLAV